MPANIERDVPEGGPWVLKGKAWFGVRLGWSNRLYTLVGLILWVLIVPGVGLMGEATWIFWSQWLQAGMVLLVIWVTDRVSPVLVQQLWRGTALLFVGLLLYFWLVEVALVLSGLLVPLMLSMILPWRMLGMAVVALGLVLISTAFRVTETGLFWPYLGAFGISSWMALVLVFKVRQMDDSLAEASSDYPPIGMYNDCRMVVDLGREISRSERGETSLIVLMLNPVRAAAMSTSERHYQTRYAQALCSVLPPHCTPYRYDDQTLVVLMPLCTVDDVVLLKADLSDALELPLHTIHGLSLVYVPQSHQRYSTREIEERIDQTMSIIRKLAQ